MFYVDNNSGVNGMPPLSPPQSSTPTWFTEGDKHKGISYIGQDWLNIIQAELLNILAEAGIVPDKGKLNQLTLAVKTIIAHNAYIQANHLREIADAGADAQAAARQHLGLGALSSKDDLSAADVGALAIAQNGADVENPPLFVKNLGLQETVDRAANAVQKTGDSMSGQLKISGVDALRIYDASYGMIFRRSENYFYLIPTEANQGENGPIGPLRPLTIGLDTGLVTLGQGATVNGGLGVGVQNTMGGSSIAIGDNDSGFRANGDGNIALMANSVQAGNFNEHELIHRRKMVTQIFDAYTSGEWSEGAGGFAHQLNTNAPFNVPMISRPRNDNTYFPLVKGKVILTGAGYPVAGSLGLLTLGRDAFPEIIIHAKTDTPSYDRIWSFSPIDGAIRSPGRVYSGDMVFAGSAGFATNGDVLGSVWNNNWLSTWLYNQFLARDNNINGRATWDYVNGTFVRDVRLAGAALAWLPDQTTSQVPPGCVLTGLTLSVNGSSGTHVTHFIYRGIQKNINGNWYNTWSI